MLLIDELDRADEAFEAFLLEVLADFQVTIPELGTIKAAHPPIVVITSNRTREIHDALKRRCLYHWVGYPNAARELKIVRAKVPGVSKALSEQIVHFVQALRKEDLFKIARRCRDARLGRGIVRARRRDARSGDSVRHARCSAQVSGRHRADRRQQGQGTARPGSRRTACGGVMVQNMLRSLLRPARLPTVPGLPSAEKLAKSGSPDLQPGEGWGGRVRDRPLPGLPRTFRGSVHLSRKGRA